MANLHRMFSGYRPAYVYSGNYFFLCGHKRSNYLSPQLLCNLISRPNISSIYKNIEYRTVEREEVTEEKFGLSSKENVPGTFLKNEK